MTAWIAVLRFWATGWLWPFADPSTLLPLQAPADSAGTKAQEVPLLGLPWSFHMKDFDQLRCLMLETDHLPPLAACQVHMQSMQSALQGANTQKSAHTACTPAQPCLTLAAVQLTPPTACTVLPVQQTQQPVQQQSSEGAFANCEAKPTSARSPVLPVRLSKGLGGQRVRLGLQQGRLQPGGPCQCNLDCLSILAPLQLAAGMRT